MSTMAFVTPLPVFTRSTNAAFNSVGTCRRTVNVCRFRPVDVDDDGQLILATSSSSPTPPPPPSSSSSSSNSPSRPRTSAPVIDSRIASRHEVHHWISVKDHSRRVFEKAAVAQVDVARQLENKLDAKALHRWVLREHHIDGITTGQLKKVKSNGCSRYLCSESFDQQLWMTVNQEQHSMTRRWLAAVERVGPLISAVDFHTRAYNDVFTAKVHDVVFNPHHNVVLITVFNVRRDHSRLVRDTLVAKAERCVSKGICLEFSVLQSDSQPEQLFKSVQIFPDMNALHSYVNDHDQSFSKTLLPHLVDDRPNRHVFTPVVFS